MSTLRAIKSIDCDGEQFVWFLSQRLWLELFDRAAACPTCKDITDRTLAKKGVVDAEILQKDFEHVLVEFPETEFDNQTIYLLLGDAL